MDRAALAPYIRRITGRPEVEFSVGKMVGDASTREYFRIDLGPDATPKSLVLMKFEAERALASDEAVNAEERIEELPFLTVQRYLSQGGLPVPEVLLADVDHGLVFLEDLGDRLLMDDVLYADDETRHRWYSKAIDLLVRFQDHNMHFGEASGIHRRFDKDLLLWEFEHYLEWGIEALYEVKMTPAERGTCREVFSRICDRLLGFPQMLVHRDFQSRNLMVRDGALALIDFQDTLYGPWPYDLTALLFDSYVVLSETLRDRLIREYVERFEKVCGSGFDLDAFEEQFYLQALQRKTKDAGRFVFIDKVRKNPSFLQYLPDTLGYVKLLLSKVESMAEVWEILGRYEERLRP